MAGKQPEVLDAVREWLGRYISTVNDGDLDLLALWAAHTHLVNETYTTPRLLLDSPVPGSGKTTALEHLHRLCVRPVQMAAVSSTAMLARLLVDGMRTMLIDEADRTLRPDKEGTPDLIAMLNSGYKRGATRPVSVPVKGGDWTVKEMPTFAPVAMAGNSPQLPEDTRQRVIRVLLLPDLQGRIEESDWELIEDEAQGLAESLAAWAEFVRPEVASNRPEMPEGVVGRLREKWQPLARVAAAAGGRWPEVVDELAAQDRDQVQADKEDGMIQTRIHIMLLQHIGEVWPEGEMFLPTQDLVDRLIREHPDTWGSLSSYGKALTAQRLGRMLATNFKVNSGRRGEHEGRGYFLAALVPVWQRLGIPGPSLPTPLKETDETGRTGRTDRNPGGSAGSAGSVGSPEGCTPEPVDPWTVVEDTATQEPSCTVCGQILAASSARDGFTTCPSCQPVLGLQ